MLPQNFNEGICFAQAWYSAKRNAICIRQDKNQGAVNIHVNAETHIIAATEYTFGHRHFPLFSDAQPMGELFLSTARIGNYDTHPQGLIGTIHAKDLHRLMEEESIDSIDELLMQFNELTDRNEDVLACMRQIKGYLKPCGLICPEDKEQVSRVSLAQDFAFNQKSFLPWSQSVKRLAVLKP